VDGRVAGGAKHDIKANSAQLKLELGLSLAKEGYSLKCNKIGEFKKNSNTHKRKSQTPIEPKSCFIHCHRI
jgi:hypothetical protein